MTARRVFAAFAVFAAASSLRAACPVPKFDAPPSYMAGASPVVLAVANINGDRWPDLVVGNTDGEDRLGGVAVLLGEPNAKFGAPTLYELDSSIASIAVADFDNDGDDDVVAFDFVGTAALVLRNDRGVLVRAAKLPLDDYYSNILTGDFDGDGRADFVVVDSTESIILFMGRGDLTFAQSRLHAGAALGNAVVRDFDGDGRSDVATIRSHSNTVTVFFGTSGGFRPVTWSFAVPDDAYPRYLFVGDFNGDRKADLLVPLDVQSTGLILDAGSGPNATVSLTSPVIVGNSRPPSIAADFDGDGIDDIALTSPEGVRIVHASKGSFSDAGAYMLMGGPVTDIAAADLDHDGDADVVALSWGGRVNVLRNDSANGVTKFRSPLYSTYPSAVADFNHDGRDDVLNGSVAWLAKPDGTLAAASAGPSRGPTVFEPFPTELRSVAVGDLDNDGNLDFIYLGHSPVYPFNLQRTTGLGKGDGTFRITIERLDQYDYESAPSLADVDGDGRLDLIAVVRKSDNSDLSWPVIIARGNGDGTFGPALEHDYGQIFGEVRIGDFNGDHKPDLFVTRVDDIALNDGHGNFGSPIASTIYLADGFGIGDLNGDGIDDVAAVSASEHSTVFVSFGRGDGTFFPAQELSTVISGVGDVVIKDMNGDGNKDIFIIEDTNSSGRTASAAFLAGDGKGHFGGSVRIPTTGLGEIRLGDFNGDGIIDLEDSGFARLGTCTQAPERHHAVR